MSRSSTTRDRVGSTTRTARPARTAAPVTPLGRRRTRRRRALGWVAGLVVLAALAGYLWAGPLLAVRTVRVDGASTLPAQQVREAAGVTEGTPLLQVDVDAATRRVAELPQVADVQVSRGWPATVVITVVERTPLAVVEEAGRRTLVDADGVLFDTITGPAPAGVVRLEVADPGPGDAATDAALAAVAALPAEVRARVVRVTADAGGSEVALRLGNGTSVAWGGGADSPEKAAVLVALLSQIDAGRLEAAGTLDVSEPGAVVLR
jgi:cell division protein FtsQ